VLGAEQALINIGLNVSAAELAELPFEQLAQRLQRLGLPSEFAQLEDESIPGTLLPIVSPLDGTVTQCDLIAGEVVDPTRRLFTIADPSRLVLTLHVAPADAAHVQIGQVVHFRPDGALREAATQVSWIAAAAKERTRTVPIRAELNNEDGRLLASSFGLGRIVLRSEPNAVVVPKEAIQSDGDCQLVFVRDKYFLKPGGPKVFHVRTVRTGARDAKNTEVIVGILPGEVVAAKGSEILLNELRRHENTQLAVRRQLMKQRIQTTRETGTDRGNPTH
jgi:cobalt-zinc-cadmium efflux system membrane fusion protein